jgi:hypothetical protein
MDAAAMIELHSCSYFCERPACIKAQRDEMRDNRAYEQGEDLYKAIRRECDLKLVALETENAALRVDAERYRWFRLQSLWDAERFPWPDGFEYPEALQDDGAMLDAAIDAARKA